MPAAAALLERAAELTPDPRSGPAGGLAAAGALLASGSHDRARELLERAAHSSRTRSRAQAMRMEGVLRFAEGRGGDTPSLLLDAATLLGTLDQKTASYAMMEALEAAMWAADLTTATTMRDVARVGTSIERNGPLNTADLLLRGYSERLRVGHAAAAPWWRQAVAAFAEDTEGPTRLQLLGMLWNATGDLLDFEANRAVARERVRLARKDGALSSLPVALDCLAFCELLAGHFDVAEALGSEALEIAAASGAPDMPGGEGILRLLLRASQGRAEEARTGAEALMAEGRARGQGLAIGIAERALIPLELACGHYEDALRRAVNVFDADHPYVCSMALGDMIEAAVRCEDGDAARSARAPGCSRRVCGDAVGAGTRGPR